MKKILIILIMLISVIFASTKLDDKKTTTSKSKVTFIELGSVNCIPCKQMKPVIESIEKRYGDQVKVIFYDVWKEDQKKYATLYKVKLIPTQVFLDENGKEFHRHQGFYPEKDIDKVLESKGLKATLKAKK